MKTEFLNDISNMVNKIYFANNYGKKTCNDDLMKHNLWNYLETLRKNFSLKQNDIICFFDSHENEETGEKGSWRYDYIKENNVNVEYKSGRSKNEEVNRWIKYLEENIDKINFRKIKVNNLEADDCIALYTKEEKNKNKNLNIISSDEDFYQLINDFIKIYDFKNKKFVDLTKKEAKIEAYIKVMCGDNSDKIPNITKSITPEIKFGEITAKKYIEEAIVFTMSSITKIEEFKEVFLNTIFDKIIEEKYVPKLLSLDNVNVEKESENIKKLLKNNYDINYKLISFSEIPHNLVENFKTEFSNLKEKKFSDKQISDFYKKEKCFKLSEMYKEVGNEVNR